MNGVITLSVSRFHGSLVVDIFMIASQIAGSKTIANISWVLMFSLVSSRY